MPARATQPAGYSSGQAQVQVTGGGAVDVDTLEVCISGLLDSVEKHLDPRLTGEAWTTTYAWFRPGSPRADGATLLFDLEPSVTWHLRPHTPYVLRLRDARGLKREERLTWVAIRLPSQAPQGYVPPAGPVPKPAAAKAPAPADADEPAEAEAQRAQAEREAAAAAALAVDLKRREDAAEKRRLEEADRLRREQEEREPQEQIRQPARGKLIIFAGIAALLLAVAVGAWFFKDRWMATETPVAAIQPEVPTTLEGARQFLARDPGADESFGMAEKFRLAKSLDGEFLLLRNAANKGNAPAALALGQMYDPATYSPETSPLPAPNPEQAVEWYRQGAEAGIAEAQYRLGVLLMSGKTDEPNGPEMGVSWLRKAADQGHQPAKDALPK
jgi:TPR repeat protein